MVDILHRVGIENAAPEEVYRALTTIEGLAGWWTDDTSGSTELGGVIEFRFPPGGFDMEVIEHDPPHVVTWKVADGPEEWIGTTIRWQLRRDGAYTIVLFEHRGWREPVEFMYHCSTKWATYLMSLKGLLETGSGAPSPRDVHVAYPD